MVWTPPTHVGANSRSDSEKFNAETVDNLTYLQGPVAGRFGKVSALEVPNETFVSFGWDFAVHETHDMWGLTPYPERVTPPIPGFWLVNVRIVWPAGTGVRAVRLQKNGVTMIAQDNREALSGNTSYTSLTGTLEMDGVGDYFNVHVWQNSGSTVTIPALSTHAIDVLLPRG